MFHPWLPRSVFSRRDVLRAGVLSLGGLTIADLLRQEADAASAGQAKHCIFVFLNGGQAQLDTFDMKPDAPEGIRGPYKPVDTAVPGIQISEKLPLLARLTDKFTVIRSMTHHLSAHNSSAAYALSGHSPGTDQNIVPTVMDHPTYGSIVAKLKPAATGIPSFVLTPRLLFDMGFPTPSAGGGWLGHAHDPFPVVRNRMMARAPEWDGKLPPPSGLQLPDGVTTSRMMGRQKLLATFDDSLAAAQDVAAIKTLNANQQQALDLITSSESQAAFDLSQEPATMHDRYGRSEMGQVLLLSRRLIEAGVRFVTANAVSNPKNTQLSSFQIWDTHFDHFRLYNDNLMPEFDQALSALLSDLDQRGLLNETLVVVMGEMGRTPKINSNKDGGRDHWGKAYSALVAGGGLRAGEIYGSTDKQAGDVTDKPVKPDDLAATLFESLGIPYQTVLKDIAGRPRHITDGSPVAGLLG
ncbi:MAG: DUF1501 domain-containing protein [Planctomycetota bacterium]|nr:DUF1501 domain-containing protein [Planctomycetota bacterium]